MAVAGLVGLGCATKGNVRLVETQVAVLRAETARQDSARAAELARIIRLQQNLLDSLSSARHTLAVADVRLGNELIEVQRQLLAIQELSGQSQARLSQLQAQLDTRAAAAEVAAPPPVADSLQPGDSTAVAAPPVSAASADQMYQGALQQYRRGSILIARRAFLEFLDTYESHPLVPDAMYYVAETYDPSAPDSAIARFNEVITRFPQSRRASAALYRIGFITERQGNPAQARAAYQRLIDQYPRSEEADLARGRLASLRP